MIATMLVSLLSLWPPVADNNARPTVGAPSQSAQSDQPHLTTYDIDLARSYVEWTGTKFRGRGKHEGIVRLRSGHLGPCTPAGCRGTFRLDMHNLEITDIPKSDAVPRRRLLEHLRSRDFFWTERYPEASFELVETRATPAIPRGAVSPHNSTLRDSTLLLASGHLTLRGITQSLAFPVRVVNRGAQHVHMRAELVIDRQRWGISYRFDPIRNEIVDDEIKLVIIIVARAHKIPLAGNDTLAPDRVFHSQ